MPGRSASAPGDESRRLAPRFARLLAALLLLALPEAAAQPYRINCGGYSYNDVFGRNWSADLEYSAAAGRGAIGGVRSRPSSSSVGGTRDGTLYQYIRVGAWEYRFDVPNGTYTLGLRFAERERHGGGLRVMQIEAEGVPLLSNLDVAGELGKDYAVEYAFRVDVADGQLNVTLTGSVGPTLICGISVVATPPDAVGPSPASPSANARFRTTVVYWNRGSENDLAGYQVLAAPTAGGPFTLVSDPVVYIRRWVDTTIQPGATRYYQIRGVDVFGNVGAPSATVSATARRESESPLRAYDLYITPQDLLTLNTDPYQDDYVPAEFYFGNLGDPQARARYRGYLTRRYSKKSFNVRFDGRPFEGRDKLILKAAFGESTFLRERMAYHVIEGCGVATPWTRYAHLHLNTRHPGLFVEIESIGPAFLDRHRLDEGADIYKAEAGRLWPSAHPQSYVGSYEKKTNTHEPYTALIDLIETVSAAPAATLDVEIAARVDVQRVLDYYAGNTLASVSDFTWRNYYMYRNRSSGLFWILPWDKDASFSSTGRSLESGGENMLLRRVLEVPLYRTIYAEKLQALLGTIFVPVPLKATMWSYYADAQLDAEADIYKTGWESNSSFHAGPSSLESFIDGRYAYVSAQLPGFVTPVSRALLINEVQARNVSTLADGAGDYDDWIELHNNSGAGIDAGGWFLTNDARLPTLWMIPPGTMIPAGGKLVIWADNEPWEGPLHANFRVSGDGEALALFAPLAQGNGLVDLVGIEPQLDDHTFGRTTDGGPLWRDLASPTPGQANTDAGSLPPVVWGTSLEPSIPVAGVPVTVRTMVTDDQGSIARVDLHSEVGGTWAVGPMADDGLPPDAFAGDGEYVYTVPPALPASIVHYYFNAEDGAGNAINEPMRAPVDALAYGVPSETAPVRINEVCADNDTLLADGAGDFDDWIELYNATAQPYDVSGMFLSDNLDDSTEWEIPAGTVIPAGGYLLIWADNEPLEGPLHSTFRLSDDGDSVGLFDTLAAGNGLVDAVTFGRQRGDRSAGRTYDGGPGWDLFETPTPGASNGPAPPPPPACPVTRCADCDLDGDVDILDCLAASQHAVNLITLTGEAFANCDVNAGSSPTPTEVTVLDALLIAIEASGQVAGLDCCP